MDAKNWAVLKENLNNRVKVPVAKRESKLLSAAEYFLRESTNLQTDTITKALTVTKVCNRNQNIINKINMVTFSDRNGPG